MYLLEYEPVPGLDDARHGGARDRVRLGTTGHYIQQFRLQRKDLESR